MFILLVGYECAIGLPHVCNELQPIDDQTCLFPMLSDNPEHRSGFPDTEQNTRVYQLKSRAEL
jgi:hypothetical protein